MNNAIKVWTSLFFTALLTAVVTTLLTTQGTAMVNTKRTPPAKLKPVRGSGIEYRAPQKMIGCVEAWNTAENQRIWFRQIYTVQYNPSLEGDVQDVFISGLKLEAEHQRLTIENEKGGIFTLNLETLEVQTVKGQSVVRFDN